MAKKKKVIQKKKTSSVPEKNRTKPGKKSAPVKQTETATGTVTPAIVNVPEAVIETPPVETPTAEPVIEIPVVETPTIAPVIETPAIEIPTPDPDSISETIEPEPVPVKRKNTLLEGLLQPTEKDLTGISNKAQEIADVYEEVETVSEDGKITVDDKQLRAEARLTAVLHVSGVSFGLSEIGNLVFNPADNKRYLPSPEGRASFEKSLGDYYFMKSKLDKKRRSPGWALVGASLTIVGPILFAMVIDGIKKYREGKKKRETEAQQKIENEQNRMFEMMERFKVQGQPEAEIISEKGVDKPEVKRTVTKGPVISNGQRQNGGRHKLSCPRSKNKDGVCNCR